ncbi:MAG: S41 family peptidase [Defluviitaleaceae bacterium]|nr:S41 family peptidase [Defluviitaleaceae bacterium]MCL2274571.1 S41 family peptidase [Defluviitaleaceae bacterium]
MKKFLLCAALFIVLSTLAACGRESEAPYEPTAPHTPAPTPTPTPIPTPTPEPTLAPAYSYTLQDLLDIANARRAAIKRPDTALLYSLVQGREPRHMEVDDYFPVQGEQAHTVSREDALYDAALFFEFMRQAYGAYTYFGGDAIFLPIFDEILETLASQDIWYTADMVLLLYESLAPYILDNHFSIGGRILGISYTFLIANEFFERSSNGLRNQNCKRYVAEVTGYNIETLFRLTANSVGELFYMPVIIRPEGYSAYTLELIYSCGEREVLHFRRNVLPSRMFQLPSLVWQQGFPVVTIRSMGFPANPDGPFYRGAQDFLSFAYELQEEPVIIIDVRSNGGGNGMLASQWMHIVAGVVIPSNHVSIRIGDYEAARASWRDQTPDNWFYQPYEELLRYVSIEPMGDIAVRTGILAEVILPNDRLFVILTDRGSASAAEGFADMLLTMENTLIIGQNTGGALNMDLTYPNRSLPRSGIPFGFGRTIFIHPEGHLIEGQGIAPDIWVMGDALNAVLAILQAKD